MKKLPDPRSSGYKMLLQVAAASGTFYQICERAEIDIESKTAERNQRMLFDTLLAAGHINLDGLIFSISTSTRDAINPPAPYVGQVAGPAYRGPNCAAPVRIARRASGARA